MTLDEMIEALEEERESKAKELFKSGMASSMSEALDEAGRMQIRTKMGGYSSSVTVYGRQRYIVDNWGHTEEGVYVGA